MNSESHVPEQRRNCDLLVIELACSKRVLPAHRTKRGFNNQRSQSPLKQLPANLFLANATLGVLKDDRIIDDRA